MGHTLEAATLGKGGRGSLICLPPRDLLCLCARGILCPFRRSSCRRLELHKSTSVQLPLLKRQLRSCQIEAKQDQLNVKTVRRRLPCGYACDVDHPPLGVPVRRTVVMAPLGLGAVIFPRYSALVHTVRRLGPRKEELVESPCSRAQHQSRPTCYGACANHPFELW